MYLQVFPQWLSQNPRHFLVPVPGNIGPKMKRHDEFVQYEIQQISKSFVDLSKVITSPELVLRS